MTEDHRRTSFTGDYKKISFAEDHRRSSFTGDYRRLQEIKKRRSVTEDHRRSSFTGDQGKGVVQGGLEANSPGTEVQTGANGIQIHEGQSECIVIE